MRGVVGTHSDNFRPEVTPAGADVRVRLATVSELPLLEDLEIAAGEQFRRLGLDLVAEDPPFELAYLQEFQSAARVFVAAASDGRPAGYLLVVELDGTALIEQVSVHPAWARRGIGRALIDRADQWARVHRLTALTLTTYASVPWNAPYYARLGFRELAESELSPGLQTIRDQESARGLDVWPRVAMIRPV